MAATSLPRDRADYCPGLLRLFDALDGKIARVRLPGGYVSAAQLAALARASTDLGDGRLELTSRGSVQLRGLSVAAADELLARMIEVGLVPSATHERVRNIVASPLADLHDVVRELDAALCDDPRLAQLSGRFFFGIDDGSGDIAWLGPDVLAVLTPDAAVVDGVPAQDVTTAMVRAAHAFLDERAARGSSAWRVAELRADAGLPIVAPPAAPALPIGRVGGSLVVAPTLGRLTAEQAHWLAGHAAQLRITPWRRVVLPVAPEADPTAVGLVTDPNSPWLRVSACGGRPGCAKALADVRADAVAALDRYQGRRVHWSGCDRRCGRTNDVEVDVVATPEGYAVRGL